MLILRWLTRNSRSSIGLKSQQPPLLIVHGTDGSHCFSLLWTIKHIPSKLVGAPKNKPPWLDKPLKVQIRQKHLAWKEYKRTRSVESLSNFRLIRNNVTKSLRLAEKQYFLSLHRNTRNTHSPTSAQHFWKGINAKSEI